MFRSYFKSGLRNLWKNKAFSAINIIGLAAGLAVCILIVMYTVDELQYDRFHTKANRIYRIDSDLYFNNTQFKSTNSPKPFGPAMLKDYPFVENYVRINKRGDILIKKGNENIRDKQVAFADSSFFQVFDFPLIAGDPKRALAEPNSIVIDESAAMRYFNSTDVIGKVLRIDNSTDCKVSGVMKDMPAQSHFHFNFLRPAIDGYHGNDDQWLSNNEYTYIVVKEGISKRQVQKAVDDVVKRYVGRQLEQLLHVSMNDLSAKGNYFKYIAMPLTDIHLHSDLSDEPEPTGNITYVYIFSLIAIFILLIACVNFMNLSTARSANRAKEVGIRKVAGSARSQLITQFLTESVIISFFALVLAISFAMILMPWFRQITAKEMHVSQLFSSWLIPVMLLLVIVVGCIAGIYPAFYLSAFQPIEVLKGRIAKGFKSSWLRSSLVVFQFSVSIVLIIGTIVIYNQLSFIRNQKLGYHREQVVVLHNAYSLDKQVKPYREELLKITGVESAVITSYLPTAGNYDENGWFRDPSFDASKAVILTNFYADENYVPTLGMEIVQGRNFSKDFPTDSTGLLLNEAAVKLFGFKDPFKETLYRPGDSMKPKAFHIVGVVKDFNYHSLHNKIGPVVVEYAQYPNIIAMRIRAKNVEPILQQAENKWKSMAPGQPFNYTFMDADFNKIYNAEQRTGKLFVTFAVFAIMIGCLGLFGLVSYAAEQRTKEIGIRKVLGSSVSNIVGMLSKDFVKLVAVAFLIAAPIAWLIMHKWLENFAYRIEISVWVFAATAAIAILVALTTVAMQAWKSALANPVKSLKTE